MNTPKPKATPYKGDTKKPKPYKGDTKKPAPYKGDTAINKFEKSISPDRMAKFEADAKKAIEKKYPGMFIPETRTTPKVKKK